MESHIVKKEIDLGSGPIFGGIWKYSLLPEPYLSEELARRSSAQTLVNGDTDVVSLQPCLTEAERSQDRFVIHDITLPNGVWRLRAVFDGHAGHETVDHVAKVLPPLLESNLVKAVGSSESTNLASSVVSDLIVNTIASVDNAITEDLLQIFPDVDALEKMSDEDIQSIINDNGPTSAKVLRCMRGTVALVCLTDPENKNLWVASLGDCQAVLGVKPPGSDLWKSTLLSVDHNGTDPKETERIKNEHPGEPECIIGNRVLGAIAVTRALGDHQFKLPRVYTERVFLNSNPGFRLSSSVEVFIKRNLSPPYISNTADIRHVNLSNEPQGSQVCLVLCSDGLIDLYESPTPEPLPGSAAIFPNDRGVDLEDVAQVWVEQVGQGFVEGKGLNLALHLLKQAMGAKDGDEEKVCRYLTAEKERRWMDDTTILVQRL